MHRQPDVFRALLTTTLLLALCATIPLRAAHAEDSAAKALLAEIEAARKQGAGLDTLVAKVPGAFAGTTDKGERKQLLGALGKVLKDAKAGAARTAAATALGSLEDKAGAWKQLSRALPKPKAKEVAPHELEAIRSAGALAQDAAIGPLLALMGKSRSVEAQREAINALGRFGASKKRTAVLGELLDRMTKLHAAAQSAAQNPKGGGAADAWRALGESLIAALDRLTGQTHANADAWIAAAKEHKKSLGKLFRDAGA